MLSMWSFQCLIQVTASMCPNYFYIRFIVKMLCQYWPENDKVEDTACVLGKDDKAQVTNSGLAIEW